MDLPVDRSHNNRHDADVEKVPFASLTPRELEVLKLVAEGLTNAQVAEGLFLSPCTANADLNCVYHKLVVSPRGGALRRRARFRLNLSSSRNLCLDA